ncbi:MAG: metalloregulator ArsR/SmtB family transcription factor [Spirochaetales bacterium]|nr:metalloregulator ArsR/SmtB family transcription factor [Spirochaetales bacterium]
MEIPGYGADNANCCSEAYVDLCASKLKVCGHPMRLRLLCRIAKQEEPCVSDLWSCLDQPQPVISQHLAVLKQKGIVTSEVRGNRRVYSIVDPFIRQIVGSLIDTPMAIPDEMLSRS